MYKYFAVADVNTSVLTDKDLIRLEWEHESPDSLIQIVAKFEYGYLIALQSEDAEFKEMIEYAKKSEYSDQFIALMRSLKSYNFSYVRLDTEGLTDEVQAPPANMWEHMEAERIRNYGTGQPK